MGKSSATDSYDVVPYLSKPFRVTHPETLAVNAALAGLETKPPSRCRVLEIGCAGGGNLLPMAQVYPNSEFVGVDISSVEIDEARVMAKAAQIGNAEFHCQDIMQFTPAGEFDFIICHGLYSWVPSEVRDRMLAICREHLTPRGVTFISHMALPGAYIWLALRHVMKLTRRGDNPAEIAAAARMTANTMAELSSSMRKFWGQVITTWVKQLSPLDSVLLHDQLGDIYHPVHLSEFIEHTTRFGLRYLPPYSRHDANHVQPAVRESMERLSSDPLVQTQLLDFARCRMYRQAVLARSDAPLTTPDPAAVVERSHIASGLMLRGLPAKTVLEPPAEGLLQEPLVKAALGALAKRWPKTMAFGELAEQLHVAGAGKPGRTLARHILELHANGVAELWLHEPTYIGDGADPQKARTTKLARAQAALGALMTNLRHTAFERDAEPSRKVVAVLDGTPPTADMLPEIAWLARNSMLVAE